MTTEDCISEVFYRVDKAMSDIPKHPLANLWPSEIVTLGILFALIRSGESGLLSWAAPRLAAIVSGFARADAVVALVGGAANMDGRVPGPPVGLGSGRQLWH